MLMSEMVDSGVRRFCAKPAIRFADRALTFAEAGSWSNRLARALIATGHAPVEARVALLLNNGFSTTAADGFSATGFDALALFSTAHTNVANKGRVAGAIHNAATRNYQIIRLRPHSAGTSN